MHVQTNELQIGFDTTKLHFQSSVDDIFCVLSVQQTFVLSTWNFCLTGILFLKKNQNAVDEIINQTYLSSSAAYFQQAALKTVTDSAKIWNITATGLNLQDMCVYLKREEIHTQIMTSPFAFIDKWPWNCGINKLY